MQSVKTILKTMGLCVLSSGCLTAFAQDQYRSYDYAKVIDAQPVYSTVNVRIPQKQCWVETVRETTPVRQQRSATPTILGSVIGGAIGHAVGDGKKNKRMGTAVGAILGGSIGNDIGKRNSAHASSTVNVYDVERCEMRDRVERRQELIGYDVDYKYNGQIFTSRLDRDPGDRLKIAVQIEPIVD